MLGWELLEPDQLKHVFGNYGGWGLRDIDLGFYIIAKLYMHHEVHKQIQMR